MKFTENYMYQINQDQMIEIIRYTGDDEKAVIPERIDDLPVRVIKKHAFAGSDITEIEVPEGIETIEDEAFAVCDYLQRIILPASVKTLGNGVFMGSEKISEVSVSNQNPRYYIEDGILYDRSLKALVFCPPALGLETVQAAPGTQIIAAQAFYGNRCLKYVRLPLTLKRIETGAFLFTNALTMIELPPYLEKIEDDSFLMGSGIYAEKPFAIYAFPDTVGYRFAIEHQIMVHPLYAIVTD